MAQGAAVKDDQDTEHDRDGDLTRRARIRNSALSRFAAHGFAGTTLRAIAEDAGVTVGLIPHYFGSKDGMRDGVERWIVSLFASAIEDADAESDEQVAGTRERNAAVARMLQENPLVVDYLRREILQLDGDGALISRLVLLTRESVDTMREAGQASTERHRVEQVVAVMVRQLGQLFLQPMVDQIVHEFPEEERPETAPELNVGVIPARVSRRP
ncbi:transcriptional regulator, TetR family [Brevibacterium jeotgali]|uniref:Transcriptional regulator, TetR family n=1 Tax=Brevibacterium jeotgali TaxID=1262550 RepID=A0A2H1L339_9MICO|nr:TetR family transcriptional regulator [Brevibacterium jeotgali]SMY11135.1 transcriptional regulator, TetR family [Brevibacterium jeotgali]